jgi:hypothetical protein
MNFDEIRRFQVQQQEIVIAFSAFLIQFRSFLDLASSNNKHFDEVRELRSLNPLVKEFIYKLESGFFADSSCDPFYDYPFSTDSSPDFNSDFDPYKYSPGDPDELRYLKFLTSEDELVAKNYDPFKRIDPKRFSFSNFCFYYHIEIFCLKSIDSLKAIKQLIDGQLLPSSKLNIELFNQKLKSYLKIINEVMMEIPRLPYPSILPNIDVNIKANNPFSAHCFLTSLITKVHMWILIIDAYPDESIFYRYLCRLSKDKQITIASHKDKLRGEKLKAFESVEVLFKEEYPKYQRKMFSDIHDRYIITETTGYRLGGSIKDAARKADFSVSEISKEVWKDLVDRYASRFEQE